MLLKITASYTVAPLINRGIRFEEWFTRTRVVNWETTPQEIEFLLAYGSRDFKVIEVKPYEGNWIMRKIHSLRKPTDEPYRKMFHRLRGSKID